MATAPQEESLVCAQCYMERGPVVDLLTRRCFHPSQKLHFNSPRLMIPTSRIPPSPPSIANASRGERRMEVRPVPANLLVARFHMCKFSPPNTCRMRDACTYAHSEEELKAWNNRRMRVGKLLYQSNRCIYHSCMWSYGQQQYS